MSVCRLSGIHNIHLSVSHTTSVCAFVIHDVCLSVCHPSVTHDVRPSHTMSCLSITHDVRLSVTQCLTVRPSHDVRPSVTHDVRLSDMMSVCMSVRHTMSVCPSVSHNVRLSFIHLCVSHMMSVCHTRCPSVTHDIRSSHTMSVYHT